MKIHPAVTLISSPFQEDITEIYFIRSEKNVLIDTGTFESPERDIVPSLKDLDLTLEDIDIIVNTHGHPDHTGGDATIKGVSGAQILIHADDADFIEDHLSSFDKYIAPVTEAIVGKEYIPEENQEYTTGILISRDKDILASITMWRLLRRGLSQKAIVGDYPEIRDKMVEIEIPFNKWSEEKLSLGVK